jgi:predicted nucleotidyltransferase
MLIEAVNEKADAITALAHRHGIAKVRVFGSVATGRARGSSDLDLLVELEPGRDLLDLIEFKLDVEELIGSEVDVVTEPALSPYIRQRVLNQARAL